jgi:hypothetical protein
MTNISVEQDWNQEKTTYWVELDEITIGVADTNGDVDLVRKDHEGDAVLVRYHEDTWYTEALEALLETLDRDDETERRLHSLVGTWLWDQCKARA